MSLHTKGRQAWGALAGSFFCLGAIWAAHAAPTPSPTPLSQADKAEMQWSSLRSTADACRALEGKVVTYFDESFYVTGCRKRPIDFALFQKLSLKHSTIQEIPARVYRMIPTGAPLHSVGAVSDATESGSCQKWEKKIVTADADSFYLIENCKKRPLASAADVSLRSKNNSSVLVIEEKALEKIPKGQPLPPLPDAWAKVWSQMDGQTDSLSLSKAANMGQAKPAPATPESFCQKNARKVLSFYGRFFILESCALRAFSGFETDPAFQQWTDTHGGIVEIPSDIYVKLKKGAQMDLSSAKARLQSHSPQGIPAVHSTETPPTR